MNHPLWNLGNEFHSFHFLSKWINLSLSNAVIISKQNKTKQSCRGHSHIKLLYEVDQLKNHMKL